jgi:hypothetical protein
LSFTTSRLRQRLSLRTGELPEAGINEGSPARQYVVFGTDNPANCASVEDITGPCAEPGPPPAPAGCDGPAAASRTRSVMTVYAGSPARFTGLYDLSAPATRYGPACQTAPAGDTARFVNVQLLNGPGGYVYVWGTEGGANNDESPVYLERIPVKRLDSGHGTQVWDAKAKPAHFVNGPQQLATPLFTDHPAPCMAQFGIEHNPYRRRPTDHRARFRWSGLPGMSQAFALMAAINGSTGSGATLSHGLV